MWSPKVKSTHIGLPEGLSHLLREYTASPPEFHTRTPRTATDFPFDKRNPQRTGEGPQNDYGYLSLLKVKIDVLPEPHAYEAQGFIPLCSVAVVEGKDEAKDHFSPPLVKGPEASRPLVEVTAESQALVGVPGELGPELQPATVIQPYYAVSYESHGFMPLCSVALEEKMDEANDYFPHTMTGAREALEEEIQSVTVVEKIVNPNTPTPRPTSEHLRELMHPTGSPVHECDITPMRRGGHEFTVFDTLDRLERNDQIFDKHILGIEISILDLERDPSFSSFSSAKSGFVHPNDRDADDTAEDLDWQDIATSKFLLDSDSSDESDSKADDENDSDHRTASSNHAVDSDYQTALSNQKPESEYPTVLAYQSTRNMNPKRSDMNAEKVIPCPRRYTQYSEPQQTLPSAQRHTNAYHLVSTRAVHIITAQTTIPTTQSHHLPIRPPHPSKNPRLPPLRPMTQHHQQHHPRNLRLPCPRSNARVLLRPRPLFTPIISLLFHHSKRA